MDIHILDPNFRLIKIIDSFESFIWTDRYNRCGDFEMYLPMQKELLDYLKGNYYVRIKDSDRLMMIENLNVVYDYEDGDKLIVKGRSLEVILERRSVLKEVVYRGTLQAVIQSLIRDNITQASDTKRRIPNFIFETTDNIRIASIRVEIQLKGEDLYSVIADLCKECDVGFKVVLNENNQFVFSLYDGTDRSYDQTANPYVIFSPKFDNMVSSDFYSSLENHRNVAYVDGEKATMTVGDTSASGLFRKEIYVDGGDISAPTKDEEMTDNEYQNLMTEYRNLLKQKGTQELAQRDYSMAYDGEIDPLGQFKYNRDFFIGDIVQLADEYGHNGTAYVTEVIVSKDNKGYSVYPTFKMTQDEEGM